MLRETFFFPLREKKSASLISSHLISVGKITRVALQRDGRKGGGGGGGGGEGGETSERIFAFIAEEVRGKRAPTEQVVDYFESQRSQRKNISPSPERRSERSSIEFAMKRAREAQKELQRKTEVLASARGGGAREKKETTKTTTKDVEAREGEEKENGARKMKKTKASEVKDREEKRIERDRRPSEKLFPAMTPRKPPQSARGRGKGSVNETARKKEEGDGKNRKIAKRTTTTTAAVTARETTREHEKYANMNVIAGAIHQLEKSFSSSKSNNRETIAAAAKEEVEEDALLLFEKPSSGKDNIKDTPVIIIDGKETMEAKVIRESMSANHALRFHKERLEEEDVRDLDARVNDETNDFRVFYLPPPRSKPKTQKTTGSGGLSAITAFAQQQSKSTKRKTSSIKSTTSRTDSKGDYRARPGDHLAFRFEVKETLGSGTFGRVVKCVDHDVRSHDENTGQKRSVAIKIIKNKEEYRIQARTELAVLEAIESARIGLAEDEEEKEREEKREKARMKRNAECVVRAIEHFNFRTHACIVFELLHCNLYEWMVDQRFTGASERVCKTVAKQLARALSFLKSLGIIHCDVKPENILLERRSETVSANPLSKVSSYPSTARAGFPSSTQKYDAGNGNNIRVKLIDFGSSCFAHVPRIYPYVQSRFYRAPEVMLRDREYDQSIDMWSFACVLAELKRGSPIWPGTDEAEQLELAKETLGAPSSAFLNKLRREEESRKTSSDSDFDDELTKNSMKKHDSHARASLSRVVPTTPMKTKKGVKSRRLLADRANDPVETDVFDGEENENEHHHQHRDEDEDDFETTTSKTTAPAAPSSGSSSLFLPFETAREKASRRKLAAEGLKKALGRGCSIKFAQFLQRCFEWDPEERLTPDDALRHAWLKSFSVGSSSSSENDEIDLNRPTADDDGGFFAKYGNTKNGNGGFDRHPSASAR